MANLPEPDWLTLFESAKRATRALGGAHTAIETALTAAFLDGKIHTRGRCRSYSGHDTLHPLGKGTWDRATVVWRDNKFTIPDERVGREKHIFSDVAAFREDLEGWINGATPVSQHGPQEAVEIPSPAQVTPVEQPKQPSRRKPAELTHERWITRARELKNATNSIKVAQIAQNIWREEYTRDFAKLPAQNKLVKAREPNTIRRVLYKRRSEWDIS